MFSLFPYYFEDHLNMLCPFKVFTNQIFFTTGPMVCNINLFIKESKQVNKLNYFSINIKYLQINVPFL